jgi:photosystem II stability/assembly factor-like uncharacterized protein
VKIESAYKGIDVIYYGNQRQLEHDFNVAPGADFKVIRLRFDGARKIHLNQAGDLVIETAAGALSQSKPVAYQEVQGERREVQARYVLKSNREIMFDVGDYDRSLPLVIDPILSYSTYLGASGNEYVSCIAVDSAGNAYIAGRASSDNFPVTPGAFRSVSVGLTEVFVAKLNASGNALLYSTYIGGFDEESSSGIAIDTAGNAYVTGITNSSDFPVTAGAYQNRRNGNNDVFALKLNASGSRLIYSTYIGGSGDGEYSAGIAIDSTGNAYIVGRSDSNNFPLTPGALDTKFEFGEAFITKLNETGSALVYSTFLGGNGSDNATGIAIDAAGNAYVAGATYSSDFPLSHPLQREPGGQSDAFIAKIDAKGKTLVYSTYLGGDSYDLGGGIAVDDDGNAYVTGDTNSSNFPTTQDVLQNSLSGSTDVFVAKLSQSGKKLIYSTLLGGTGTDVESRIAIDASGYAYVTGLTTSADFPLANPLQDQANSGRIFKSTDGGNSWHGFGKGLADLNITSLAIDSQTPSTLYAKGFPGISKSTDGGINWKTSLTIPPGILASIGNIAIDPLNTSNIYTCAGSGIYKTTDAGNAWKNINITPSFFLTDDIVIDPKNPAVIYVWATPAPIPAPPGNKQTAADFDTDGVFRSTDSGETWTNLFIGSKYIDFLAIDPVNTSTLYVGSVFGILKSTDAGLSWVPKNKGMPQPSPGNPIQVRSLVIDPQNPERIYGAGSFRGLVRSTDGGENWNHIQSPNTLGDLVIDPQNTNTIYAVGINGFLKSSNRGEDMMDTELAGIFISSVVIDPFSSSTIYAASYTTNELFVAKLDRDGAALVYSTYIGGLNRENAYGITTDSSGNVYVVGSSVSKNFPVTAGSFQTSKGNLQDGFVFKISDPRISAITGVSIKGKKLIVTGKGFDVGAVILVNGIQQKTANDESNPATMLIARKAGKQIARGQDVTIQVRNIDGTPSVPFPFRRPD